jgi:hypothetical protein
MMSPEAQEKPPKKTAEEKKNEALQRALSALPPDDVGPFRTPDGASFVRIKIGNHFEHWPLRSQHFTRYVEKFLYAELGGMPDKKVVADLLRHFEGIALFDGDEIPVHLRVAKHGDNIFLDLCDDQWRAVEISASGWRVVSSPSVRFRRTAGMRPLPGPTGGGTIREFLSFLNLGSREQQLLTLTWILAALRPGDEYPLLALKGSQGSAKSTCQRILRSIVDPSDSPLRTAPRDERDLMISAKHAHLIGFDNLSHIPPWLSDALCRLSTGGGLATRELYSNEKEILFNASRPVLINGIADLADRGDLLDRIVYLQLPSIAPDKRKTRTELWEKFEAARPRILGALLDVIVGALRRVGSVRLPELPRMADFAILGTAAEEALGYDAGDFMRAYARNRTESSLLALEFAPAASYIPKLIERTGAWEGTNGELLKALNMLAPEDRRDPEWPKSARMMSEILNRAEPNLATAGIKITRLPRRAVARPIRLSRIVTPTVTAANASKVDENTEDFTAAEEFVTM